MQAATQGKETGGEQESRDVQEPSPYAKRVRLYSWLVYVVARCIYETLRLQFENVERLAPNKNEVDGKPQRRYSCHLAWTDADPRQSVAQQRLLGADFFVA